VNNDNFLINSSDLEIAQDVCKFIENESIRNKSVANVLATVLAEKYFTDTKLDETNKLCEVPKLQEEFDVADIYIKNNYIDVRIYFENSPILIPLSHFEKQINPLAYMFIKIDTELSGATVTGFLFPSSINIDNGKDGYIEVQEDELQSCYDLESQIIEQDNLDFDEEFEKEIYDYLDDKLTNTQEFFNKLTKSEEARAKLKNAYKTKIVLDRINFTSIVEDLKIDESNEKIDADNDNILESTDMELVDDMSNSALLDEDLLVQDVELDDNLTLEQSISDSDDNLLLEQEEILLEENEINKLDEIPSEEIHEDVESTEVQEVQEEISLAVNNYEEIDIINDNVEDEISAIEEVSMISEPSVLEFDDDYENVPNSDNESSSESLSSPAPAELPLAEDFEDANQYSTSTTPSMSEIENDEEDILDNLEADLDASDEMSSEEDENSDIEDNPDIDRLFSNDDIDGSDEGTEDSYVAYQAQKKKTNPLALIGISTLILATGYFAFNKLGFNNNVSNKKPVEAKQVVNKKSEKPTAKESVAMPVESVENVNNVKSDEGLSVSIPAIENNLDASIMISNLSINWEVPVAYASNNTAKRYFTKIGKIIQLNLKTELLLLTKMPISNIIKVELEYNTNSQKFNVKGILLSSGEKVVDEVIINTVNKVLNINLNMNMGAFDNISGNPILIINL